MKIDFKEKKLVKIVIVLSLAILIFSGSVLFLANVVKEIFAFDEVKEGLTLEEAQDLVPFQICLPSHLPNSIKISSTVRYHAEFGDPNESDITINLVDIDSERKLATIYERHAPGRLGYLESDEEKNRTILIRDLLGWLIGWNQVDEMKSQVIDTYEIVQSEDGEEYRIVEITSPDEARGVVVFWNNDPVIHYLFSILSVDETMEIVSSIPDCNQGQ